MSMCGGACVCVCVWGGGTNMRIFFPPPVLSFLRYVPFSTMYEQPC